MAMTSVGKCWKGALVSSESNWKPGYGSKLAPESVSMCPILI